MLWDFETLLGFKVICEFDIKEFIARNSADSIC